MGSLDKNVEERKMKKNVLSIMGAGLFSVTLFLSPTHAAIINIDTSIGNGADSYISTWPGEQTQNFGDAESLYLKNDAGTGFVNRKTYMRFDLSDINASLLDATLLLSFFEDTDPTAGNREFNVYGLIDGHNEENWDEYSITWNNAPANNTGSASGLISGEYVTLGSFQFNSAGATPGDSALFSSAALTTFLQNDTDDLATLIIIRQDRTLTNIGFASKENQILSAPTLLLQPVPIPAGIWLLSSGLAGLAGTRLRRKKK
jgi:hypothetical protein